MDRSKWNKLTARERRIQILKEAIPPQQKHIAQLREQLKRAERQLINDTLKLREYEEGNDEWWYENGRKGSTRKCD